MTSPIDGRCAYRFPWKALLLIVLLTCCYRMIVITVPPPDFLKPSTGMTDGEELCRGNGAKDMIEGLLLPFQDYQLNDFWGGSIVISILAIPFFLLLGPTLVALRMSTLLFAFLTPLFAFLLLDRFVSRRAAWIGGLLLCFTPPGYTIYFSMAYGTHIESTSLAMIMLYLFMTSTYMQAGAWRHLLLGLVAGFALSCGYGVLILLALLLAVQIYHDKLFFLRRPFWIRTLGFAIGFLPWIRYNILHDFAGVNLYERSLTAHFSLGRKVADKWEKLVDFVTRDFANSFWFKDTMPIDGTLIGHVLVLVFTGLFLYALWLWRESLVALFRNGFRVVNTPETIHPLTIFLVFPFFFLAAFVLSDFKIILREWVMSTRYILILYPFLVVVAAAVIDQMAGRFAGGRRFAAAFVFLLCTLFAAGTFLQCDANRIRANWEEPGYSLKAFGRIVVLRYGNDTAALNDIVMRLEEKRPIAEQDEILLSLGMHYRFLATPHKDLSPAEKEEARAYRQTMAFLFKRVPEPFKIYFDPNVPTQKIVDEKLGGDAASWRAGF